MRAQPEHAAEEIKRLQRCINDLINVPAVPAMSSGGEPSQIAHTLLDSLLPMLHLDFVYVRLTQCVGEEPIERIRIAHSQTAGPSELGKVLHDWLHESPEKWPRLIRNPAGAGEIAIVPLRLGLHGELGLIVAGSHRPDFPAQTERLVLSVAANQAAIGLQEARLLSERRRVARELDQRVAQRTAELAAANEELRKEVAERRRAEPALRQSEARLADDECDLQLTIDTIPVFVAMYQPDGTRSFVNRTWREYMGLTLEQATGAGAKTFPHFHPADAERNDKAWRAALANGEPLSIEVRVRRADGQYRWHTSQRAPLRDEKGDIVRWYSVGIDIEDQKVAEDALRRSQARLAETERELRKIINTIPALAWSARPDGTAEFFNQHYLDYVGLSLEQAQGWGLTVAVHPDDLNGLAGTWQRIMASGQSGEAEARLRRHDGEYRWFLFRVNPLRDDAGNIIKWYGTNIDIEDRKRADEALRREVIERTRAEQLARIDETRFRRFFDLPLIGMAVTSPERRFLEVNETLCHILGYPREELLGRDWASITHPDDLSGNLGLLDEAMAGATESYSMDKRYIHRDGQIVYVSISVCCVRCTDGTADHFVLTVQDVTARHQVQEQLERTEAHLKHGHQIAHCGSYEVHLPQPFGTVWSDEHYRMFGLEPGSPVPSMDEYVERFVHPDDRDYFREAVMRRARADHRFTLEYRFVRADGEVRYLQSITDPVKDESGRIVKLVGTAMDTTERKLATERLEMQTALLDQLFQSVAEATVLLDLDDRVLRVNTEFTRMFGYTAEQARGLRINDLIVPAERMAEAARLSSNLARGQMCNAESVRRREDGSRLQVSILGAPIVSGVRQIASYAIYRDITERKRVEEALRESEQRFALAVAGSNVGIFDWDLAADQLFLSVRAQELCGIEPGESWRPRAEWSTIFRPVPDDLELNRRAIRAHLAGETPACDVEYRLMIGNGDWRWLRHRGLALRDATGKAYRMAGSIEDITERKRVEEAQARHARHVALRADVHAAFSRAADPLPEVLRRGAEAIVHNLHGAAAGIWMLDQKMSGLELRASAGLYAHVDDPYSRIPIGHLAIGKIAQDRAPHLTNDLLNDPGINDQGWAQKEAIVAFVGVPLLIEGCVAGVVAMFARHPLESDTVEAFEAIADTIAQGIERKRAEQEIVRVRDLYAALSLTNRAIIHIHEPRALFQEVCRVAVEFGHFCLVWAGLLNEQTGWVEVIPPQGPASAGFPSIRVSIDPELPEGRGFSGAVLREGRHFVVNDYFADPRVAPWAEQSRSAGVKSMVTLPLKRHGRCVGVLNVHADEVGYFTDDLVRLLEEMAMSLSFALEYMERDALRAEAEAELRRSEARFRSLTELSSDWYWEQDENLRFTYLSSLFHDLTGYSRAYSIGKTRWELENMTPVSTSWPEHKAVLEARRPFRDLELRRIGQDGLVRYLSISGAPIFDEVGRFKGYEGVGRNITERKRVEEALHQAQAELAHVARVTSLGALTASIAHEVNQPLSGIITNASTCLRMLASDPPNIDGACETARRTLRDGNRASEVITRLRALFSKKDAVFDSVDLNEGTREVIAMSSSELQRGRLVARLELADDLPPVAGDRVQLQQVILNLLLNAADAMSDVEDRPRQVVVRTERDEDNRVRLSVQDVGVGLEPQSMDKLFEAFYTTKSNGMGIGLSVSRSIIERHHGRLWAAANDGPGATFSFSIPRAPEV